MRPDPIGLLGGINLFVHADNNPVNLIDPYGLIRWKSVFKGSSAIVAGSAGIFGGALASSSGVGAILGVPTALAGSASLSWGVGEVIAGFLDQELPFPKPTIPVAATMSFTGDTGDACEVGFFEDLILFGAGTGSLAAKVGTSPELINLGLDFIDLSIQSEANPNLFQPSHPEHNNKGK